MDKKKLTLSRNAAKQTTSYDDQLLALHTNLKNLQFNNFTI